MDGGGETFVHYTGIAGTSFRSLLGGQRVEFALADTRGSIALYAIDWRSMSIPHHEWLASRDDM
jgi:hypothetical protein